MTEQRQLAEEARAWPFEEARAIVKRLGGVAAAHTPDNGYVLFETGYGPSGPKAVVARVRRHSVFDAINWLLPLKTREVYGVKDRVSTNPRDDRFGSGTDS